MTPREYKVYSQAGRTCPFCERAATALQAQGLDHTVYPLEGEDLLRVAEEAGMTTVPIIYTPAGELIGGYSDLVKHLQEKDLHP